jgi:hypothetical protein
VQALSDLQWKHSLSFQHARFILASRGAYRGTVSSGGWYEQATTVGDLRRLRDAGWELCVLQAAHVLPEAGQELLQALERQAGRAAFVIRLED